MPDKNRSKVVSQESALAIEDIRRRFDMMDQRLDNIDSIVSAVVERVMSQPIVISITCPHCGSRVEVSLIGNQKPVK